MSGAVPLIPLFKFTDAAGKPLALGWVTVYLAGTTTMATTYTDMALTVPHVNPLQLDANGEAVFWLDPSKRYKFQLQDSGLVTVPGWPQDNVQAGASARMTGIVDAADLGVVMDSPLDQTGLVQAAVTSAPTGGMLYMGPGTVRYTSFTVNKALKIRGAGKSSTILRSNSPTLDGILITTTAQVELSDFYMDTTVPRTAGAYVKVAPASGVNFDSAFRRVVFSAPWIGINFVDASDFTVEDCYFVSYLVAGMQVANLAAPDNGDSLVFDCTFDGSGGAANNAGINQISSGGLRVQSNKFLGGSYHYLGQLGGQTSILIFCGNSSENAGIANIALTATNPITFSKVIIEGGNQFSVAPGATGISVTDPGYSFLDDLTVGGNTFNLAAGSQGMSLGRGSRVTVLPNSFIGNGGGTGCTGIVFTANCTATVSPQSMPGVTTRYGGVMTNVTFIPGGLVQSGTNTDTTNAAYGTLFSAPARAVVFATPYPKPPTVTFQMAGNGAVSCAFTVVPTTTGFTYQAVGAVNASAVSVTWSASGG